MKKLMTSLALGACVALLGVAAAPVALAQSEMENSTFTVTEPIDVGGFILQPGTYLIKVAMLASNRNMIQVTNVEQTKVFANVLATPHPIRGDEAAPSSRYIYYTTIPGQPKALRTWFARETSNGQDIVYPKRRAMELAAAAKEPVIAIDDTVKETEYKTVPITLVTPEQEVKPYEVQVAQTAPETAPEPAPAQPLVSDAGSLKELPRTAGRVPLFAALGLLLLGGAFGLRVFANRAA